jgi:hypothetical protein
VVFYVSTKVTDRLSSSERSLIKLPNEVKEILIGILLGDAYGIVVKKLVRYFNKISKYFVLFSQDNGSGDADN